MGADRAPAAPYAIHVGHFGRAVRGLVTAIIGCFLVRQQPEPICALTAPTWFSWASFAGPDDDPGIS